MSDEKRKEITDALVAAGIEYRAILTQKGAIQPPASKEDKPWEHDAWMVRFSCRANGRSLGLPFKCGIGHRKPPAFARSQFERSPKMAYDRRQLEAAGVPQAPHAADVLHSLVSDDTHGASFRDWCADFGYDEDSRKALALYEQCQRQTDDARTFFGRELFEKFGEILQDY